MADPFAYEITGPGSDLFGVIDLNTGVFTSLGDMGQTLAGLGSYGGIIYGGAYHGNTQHVYRRADRHRHERYWRWLCGFRFDDIGSLRLRWRWKPLFHRSNDWCCHRDRADGPVVRRHRDGDVVRFERAVPDAEQFALLFEYD